LQTDIYQEELLLFYSLECIKPHATVLEAQMSLLLLLLLLLLCMLIIIFIKAECRNGCKASTNVTSIYDLCSKTNEMRQFLKFILFCSNTPHVSDGLSVHHQESKTVHTAPRSR